MLVELPDLPMLPPGLVAELRRDPTYALETLALAAVEVHGPAAEQWIRERGPLRYSPDQLAKSATKRFTNVARLEGAALGFGGIFTAAPDTAALIWILTREVLFVAASYGMDPTDKARAAEMLVIFEVYDTVEAAQAGLDRQGERLAMALARTQIATRLQGSERSFTDRLVRYASKRAAKRYGGRLIPGLGAILGSIDNAASARRIGDRAVAYYRTAGTPKRGAALRKWGLTK